MLWAASASAQTQTITVSGRSAANSASVAGFGDVPLSSSPFSATVITQSQLLDAGIASLGDVTKLDAGTTDAYNAPGYWGQLAVRGFTLDNRYNVRRDGLPINAETVIPAGNKQALEILKGTSGLQAGTSAPGGLLNLVVKRPAGTLRSAQLAWEQDGSLALAVDVGDATAGLGWRVNAALERLDTPTQGSRGHRGLAAVAIDLELGPRTRLQAEVEASRQSQPSTPGISLLGDTLPDPRRIDPRTNLNRQPWTLPVVMDGNTGSLRITHEAGGAQWTLHALRQALRTDDRIAFPFGCFDGATGVYYADRYCPDGSFDLYDYRSEGERRTTDAVAASVRGQARWGGLAHRWSAGVLQARHSSRFGQQAYNYVGSGSVFGSAPVAADPTLAYENTQRDERSTEWRVQDVVDLGGSTRLWAGLRHTTLQRDSVRTDGSEPVSFTQRFTTPWLALSTRLAPGTLAYASTGQGVELEVVPNRPAWTRPGRPLPALKSRQWELGLKGGSPALDWRVAAFDIRRPVWSDLGPCDVDASCTRQADGAARHRGVEAEAEGRWGAWALRGSAMALQARREGASDPALNGLRPANVPATSVKLQAAWNASALPGLSLLAFLTHEGERMVLPDNSVATPGWTRLDLGLRYAVRWGERQWTWRAGVDNVLDRRAWKESPFQYGHAYLYPLPARAWHASLSTRL